MENQVNRDTLVEEHRVFAEEVVRRLIRAMHLPREMYDELLSAAYLGLVEAAGKYEPDRGVSFRQFAYLRVRGSVIDLLRENSDISPHAYRYCKALKAASDARIQDQEVASQLVNRAQRSKTEKLAGIMNVAAKGAIAFRLAYENWEEEVAEERDCGLNPEEALSKLRDSKKLRELVETLPEKERMIVESYYFEDKSFVEIVNENEGLSKSWVSRLHSRALRRIADQFDIQQLNAEI